MSRSTLKRGLIPTRFSGAWGYSVIILVLGSVLLTSACGFKLRGEVDIPEQLNPMFVKTLGASPVRNAIVEQLRGSQVELAASPQSARVIIRINSESRSSRVVALDRSGKVLARELHYHVEFDVVAPDGKQLVPPQALDLVRSYNDPDVAVLGKQLEETLIYEDLVRESANRILGRLRMVLL